MNNKKPKGKTPSLIGGTLGKPRKTPVERVSTCKRCKTTLNKGVECYEIPQLGGAFVNYKRYCDDCFQAIIEKTKEDLSVYS